MKRLLGVREMRDILAYSDDVYEIVEKTTPKANKYALDANLPVIQTKENNSARARGEREEGNKKL